MKILKIASYYKTALNYYYGKYGAEVIGRSYKEQLEHLLKFSLGWGDSYARAFRKLGHEAEEIVANAEPLQKQWAKEHGLNDAGFYQIVQAQIADYNPDVIWFQDPLSFSEQFLSELKVKVLVGNLCSPYNRKIIERLRIFDFVTTCSPQFVEELGKFGVDTLLLYQAFDPSILERISLGDRDIDVVFIGSILSGDGYHSRRKDFLEFLLNKGLNIEIYANVDNTSIAEVYKKRAVYLFSHFVERIGMEKLFANSLLYQKGMALNSWVRRNRLSRKMREKLRGSVFGMDMFKVLARSKICLNIHGDVVRGYAANMRIFEATGMGSLLVTENFANMKELFSENEVVLYDSFEQAYEKIVYLLDNEAELLTIARTGQQRTLEKHTYLQRAKLFLNKLEKFLS